MLMLAAIYVLFIVTYAPSLLVKMVNYFSWRDHPICKPLNYQSDKRYKNPTLHIIAYVINWATVVINPIVYVVSQKKYKVREKGKTYHQLYYLLCVKDAIIYLRDNLPTCSRKGIEPKSNRVEKIVSAFKMWKYFK